ncbi:pro-sigmaK processing inhibitor BofA [Sporolactobacillus shoreae]|uniref:Pro-sigmaK processing inhibitor BofA n=2 Tax=Sporolactobacillus shoreae TaxID=1465501 RepID=A0A4Z0GH32_9BACL|nr:pro-sigmaK processing inhibitor BofA [Sporolactobacillus shoreae]
MTGYLFMIAGVLILFFFMIVFGPSFHPVRWGGKLLVRLLIGVFLLFLLNVVGESFSLHIPINLATVSVSGLLGLPGIAALILIKYTTGV